MSTNARSTEPIVQGRGYSFLEPINKECHIFRARGPNGPGVLKFVWAPDESEGSSPRSTQDIHARDFGGDLENLQYILKHKEINRYIREGKLVDMDENIYLFTPLLDEWTTVKKKIRARPVHYMTQLIQQLIQLQRAKILHNDIKPSNILYDGQEDRLVLFDFNCSIIDLNYNYLDDQSSIDYPEEYNSQSCQYRPIECFRASDYHDPEVPKTFMINWTGIYDWSEFLGASFAFRRRITGKSDIYALGLTLMIIFGSSLSEQSMSLLRFMTSPDLTHRPNIDQLEGLIGQLDPDPPISEQSCPRNERGIVLIPVAFPGLGKSTLFARLKTRLQDAGLRVVLETQDHYRNFSQFKNALLRQIKDADLVIVDRNNHNLEQREKIRELFSPICWDFLYLDMIGLDPLSAKTLAVERAINRAADDPSSTKLINVKSIKMVIGSIYNKYQAVDPSEPGSSLFLDPGDSIETKVDLILQKMT